VRRLILRRAIPQLTALAGILGSRSDSSQSVIHTTQTGILGWHLNLVDYREKITAVLRSIFALRTAVLPVNRANVDDYLEGRWSLCIDWALQSLKWPFGGPHDDLLKEKTESYSLELEARLEDNLAAVGWDIDAPNTLSLITGATRTEHVSSKQSDPLSFSTSCSYLSCC
jgi:hypothetical protein